MDLPRVIVRLVVVATIAQPFHVLAFPYGVLPLNVLYTFAAAAGIMYLVERRQATAAIVVWLVAGLLVDYAFMGIGLTLACWLYFRQPRPARAGVVLAFLAALCLLNGNPSALAAVPVIHAGRRRSLEPETPSCGVLRRVGTRILVPNVADSRPLERAARLVIDKSDSTLALIDAAGNVFAQFPVSSGSDRDPLPIGEWKVQGTATNPTFHYNPDLFWDADPAHAKAKLPAGPNNPVGTRWIDLSKPHYGIHGTPEPVAVGKTQSHGCVRLTNWDVERVASAVSPSTPVLMQE